MGWTMSATDELRKLLDERGVEHEDKHTELVPDISGWDSTWWQGIAGMTFLAIEDKTCGREGCVYINGTHLTPEQAIAATLGSDDDYEAKMDALLCRLTNGKWSKSRAYDLDFMESCIDEEYEKAYAGDSDREAGLEALAKDLYENAVDFNFKGWIPYYRGRFAALGIEVDA